MPPSSEKAATIDSRAIFYGDDDGSWVIRDSRLNSTTATIAGKVSPGPPIDGGARAWLFMLGAFVIEAVMWGFPLSFGIFAAHYRDLPQFRDDRSIPVIGTLATGIPFLGAPFITPLMGRWHNYRRQMIWAGWLTCAGSLLAASFATKPWHLVVTQGVAYGLGFLVLYYSLLSMLNEWWVKRRGLAYGVIFAAAGISGVGLPYLIQVLLHRFGFANTLRAYAVAILALVGPILPLCAGRITERDPQPSTPLDWETIKNPLFWAFSFANLFQGLAFYLPGIYLPSFAQALALTPSQGALLLCFLNGSQVAGQVLVGWASDWVNVVTLLMVTTLFPAILAGVLWYLASRFEHMVIFSLLFGLLAGGFSVLWPRFISLLSDEPTTSLWLYGLLAFQRGLGSVSSGPLSAGLLKLEIIKGSTNPADSYKVLILFVSICLFISAFGGVAYFFPQRKDSQASVRAESPL
ncbi:MFS general substrate transporter [Trichodelitschia bisporula]|uniref:MFS general substrate transporter n=1 Tax=Trichodelitschia bisporula TaxID=703511 RepID=A0A6G1I971_9PEZI|nr:MFS general substrate transporter [Trichodelitschia bisporula]